MLGVFPTTLIREGVQPSPQNEEVEKRSQMLELSLAIPDVRAQAVTAHKTAGVGLGVSE